jgi:hypothetical protein
VAPPRRLVGLDVADPPEVWTALGFRVVGDSVVVGGIRVQLRGTAAGPGDGGVRSWCFEPAWPASIHGLAAHPRPVPADTRAPDAASHPNGVTAVDHVVVASPDVERTTAALGEAGIAARRTIVGARGDDEVLYRFFLLGTCVLELIGPAEATGAGPARFAGLAFTTTTIDDLGELIGEPRVAVQPGRRIATVRRRAGSSIPIAFLSPRL